MDVTRLRSGELLTGASAVALLAVMFLDWFGDASAWSSLSVLRVLLVATAAMGLLLVALTVVPRPVAMPVAASVITIGVAALTFLPVAFRVLVNEPGTNAEVGVGAGAYLGLALVAAVGYCTWRTLADERTTIAAARRQTERVLAVRGAARPAPPAQAAVTPGPPDAMADPPRPDAPDG